uniref:Complex I-13kD-A n=1 Tax=Panagrolaimus sp. JU765 TaxID=591449 RepID=A0AC34QWV7_9BILA
MNRQLIFTGYRALKQCKNQLGFLSTETLPTNKSSNPKEVTQQTAKFDEITHTGQAWDEADYRLQRFDENKKMVNPNIAANLISEQPPKAIKERIAKCDGGHPALGHPAVFINLDKPGTHACGYCGQRYYNPHSTKPEQLSIHHIEV